MTTYPLIAPELECMLVDAYKLGFVNGIGCCPPGLDEEAIKEIRTLPTLGKIGGIDLRRVRILKVNRRTT